MANGIFNHLLSLFYLIADIKTLSNAGVCIADERCFGRVRMTGLVPPLFFLSFLEKDETKVTSAIGDLT